MKGICGILIITILGLTYAQKGCFHEGGCIYNGKSYKESNTLSFSCFNLTCRGRVWNFYAIDGDYCDSCYLTDDPHIYSFDGQLYHWYGLCNYSLSQPAICKEDPSYEPPSAVYADFEHCNVDASCVDCTTYVINPNTVVTIEHKTLIPDTLDINGNTFSPLPTTPSAVSDCNGNFYPAMIWRDEFCAYVVGTTFSIKACKHDMFIYAKKKEMGNLVGLCGYYSGSQGDDYVPRGSCFNPIAYPDFAISWLSKVHKKDCDPDTEKDLNIKAMEIEESCNKEEFYGICEAHVSEGYGICKEYGIKDYEEYFNGDIENCVLDCCFNPDTCKDWAKIAYEMARISCETKLMEHGIVPEKG